MNQEAYSWYAVYTKPRWEKKVTQTLSDQGLVAYCPLTRVIKQWSDRKKVVHEPLFRGYTFVNITNAEKERVHQTNGVLNFVYWNGKPAVIKDVEIEAIRRFLSDFQDVSVETIDFKVNQSIRIRNGILMDYKGVLLEVNGNKAKVQLESIGLQMTATVELKNLQSL